MRIITATLTLVLIFSTKTFAQELTADEIGKLVSEDLKNKSWTNIPKFNSNPNEDIRTKSKNSFHAALKEGESEGIVWNNIELVRIEKDYGITIGANPTKYDLELAEKLKEEAKGLFIGLIFSFDDILYEFDAGYYERTQEGWSLNSEMFFTEN